MDGGAPMQATAADVIEGRARWCVVEGNAARVLPGLSAASVSALVTDPPSGIAFMNAEWDRNKGGRAQWVAWLAEILGLARAAVVPGGRSFVWALPRTTHWTGCAVEDAGWSIETVVTHLFATGWPKGASQLKPSSEHWYLARTGPSTPLEIDACRVGTSKNVPGSLNVGSRLHEYFGGAPRSGTTEGHSGTDPTVGRWPPNTVFSHAPGCVCEGVRRVRATSAGQGGGTRPSGFGDVGSASGDGKPCAPGHADPDGTELVEAWRCVEGCPVAELDAQSGELHSRGNVTEGTVKRVAPSPTGFTAGFVRGGAPHQTYDAGGTASRFFPCFPADDPATFAYIAKPSRAERNTGIEAHGPPLAPGKTTFGACEKADWSTRNGNFHPTVKPVALMRWLIRLVTKPGDVVLDCFAGSGTTGVAALLEGRRVILVEKEPRYAVIARARCENARPSPARLARIAVQPIAALAVDHGPLFGGGRP